MLVETSEAIERGFECRVVSTFMEAITLIAPCRQEKCLSVAEWSFHSSVCMIIKTRSTSRSAQRVAKFHIITPKNVVHFVIDNNGDSLFVPYHGFAQLFDRIVKLKMFSYRKNILSYIWRRTFRKANGRQVIF